MEEKEIRIHLLWTIALLIILISAILWKLPDGQSLSGYIAFAASIASLILAIVAIFYSIISNKGFSETVGSLKDSTGSLNESAAVIESSTSQFTDLQNRIFSAVTQLGPTISEISEKISQREIFEKEKERNEEGEINTSDTSKKLIKTSPMLGVSTSLYIIASSLKTGKNTFSPEDIFPKNVVFDTYTTAVIETLRAIRPFGIDISRINNKIKDEETGNYHTKVTFTVNDPGGVSIDDIMEEYNSWDPDQIKEHKEQIDKYFEG